MIITCPKCKTGYKVDDNLVPEEGKKVHCSNCGEFWVVHPDAEIEDIADNEAEIETFPEVEKKPQVEDADFVEQPAPKRDPFYDETPREVFVNGNDKLEPETTSVAAAKVEMSSEKTLEPEAENVGDIFARLNSRKEDIEKDLENMSGIKKVLIGIKRKTGLGSRKNRILLYFVVLSVSLLSLFYFRYEITKKYPFVAPAYKMLGIDAVVIGQGMHFDNVAKIEYFDEEGYPKIAVKGFVHNVSGEEQRIPLVWVKLMDKDGKIIDQIKKDLNSGIKDEEKYSFNIVIDKPRVFVKYIVVTFAADEI